MKQPSLFNTCSAHRFLIVFLLAMCSSPIIAGDRDCNDPKWADHPLCTNTDPEPDPGEDPTSMVPAFAYYCKSNPNAGAICLANADGSSRVEIFTTEKFQGDDFRISAFQDDTSGTVLVIDNFNLYRIDYMLEAGVFRNVTSQQKIVDRETSGNVHATDWNPDGTDFAYAQNGNVYLGSRNEPIIVSQYEDQGIFGLSWGASGDHIYFIQLIADRTTDDTLVMWQLRRADISDVLTFGGSVDVIDTVCLFASNETIGNDCPTTHYELWHLKDVSAISNPDYGEEVMVSAVVKETGGYATFLLIDDDDTSTVSIPNFRGRDWTPGYTILGESDDEELVEVIPPTGGFDVLLKKNATSPDWVN